MNEETNKGWVKNIYLSYYFDIGLQTCLKKYDVGDYITLEKLEGGGVSLGILGLGFYFKRLFFKNYQLLIKTHFHNYMYIELLTKNLMYFLFALANSIICWFYLSLFLSLSLSLIRRIYGRFRPCFTLNMNQNPCTFFLCVTY